jgi:chromosome transmission fidelity protein 4
MIGRCKCIASSSDPLPGEQGIVYAANPEGSANSVIEYRAYDGDPKTAAWQASLEEKERAVVVAAGGSRIDPDDLDGNGMGSVVIATSKGYIRFFTGTGLQRYIWRLGEDVVAMVASREMLFVVHREGGTSLDGGFSRERTCFSLAESIRLAQVARICGIP